MDIGFEIKNEYPKTKANLFSKLMFLWLWKSLRKIGKRDIQIDDLFVNKTSNSSETLTHTLQKNWNLEVESTKLKNKKPSFLKVLLKIYFFDLLKIGIYLLLWEIFLRLSSIVLIEFLLTEFNYMQEPNITCYMYTVAAVLSVVVLLRAPIGHRVNDKMNILMMRVRIATSSMIYRKVLKLNQNSSNQISSGDILNLLSNDVNRFDLIAIVLNYVWVSPILSLVITYYLWIEMGVAAFPGVIFMYTFTILVQAFLAKISSTLCSKTAKQTDERVSLIAQLIHGIKAIKMYAWEETFQKIITDIRNREIKFLTRSSYTKGVFLSSMNLTDHISLFLSILTYILLGQKMEPRVVFVGALLYNLFKVNMGLYFFVLMSLGGELLVSIGRIQKFLLLDEHKEMPLEDTCHTSIEVENVSCGWVEGVPILNEVSFRVTPGSLCFIIGNIGSGKSSLLHLILGELQPKSGFVKLGGTISYSSQEPWIFSSTARQNILFGQDFDEDRYRTVVRICCLETDFKNLPLGDMSLVGERGIMLSGGQKARINLARAVYRNADIYLLDDPLSAVDLNVGKTIFEECLLGLLKNKTIILVTHQLQYLKWADHIIILKDGKIQIQGSYKELTGKELDFANILNEKSQRRIIEKTEMLNILERLTLSAKENMGNQIQSESLIIDKKSVFITYIRKGGNYLVLSIICILLLLTQITSTSSVIFLSLWTQFDNVNTTTSIRNSTETENSIGLILANKNLCIIIYTALILTSTVISIFRSIGFLKISMLSSKKIHEEMLLSLLKAPMRFFDQNSSGRILNRFSKDLGAVDQILPCALLTALQMALLFLGVIVSVVYTNYYTIIIIVVVGFFFVKVGRKYYKTAKNAKHLEGIAKSPLYSHVNSSLNGITTIRASKAENILKKQFDQLQDVHTSAFKMALDCQCAFGLWIDLLIGLFLSLLVFICILYESNSTFFGLALYQGMILTGIFQYSLRQSVEVINQLASLDRILQYTKLDKEELETKEIKTSNVKYNPKGQIIFHRVRLQYSPEDPPVLKDVSFLIKPGEKIGIIGRTGAGKSSLISVLFRLTPFEGTIFIDDVDTKRVSLRDLRSNISIIPQEPILISATVRYNLDPFCLHDDSKLWEALEEVQLKDCVDSLDFFVNEGGSNFSVGQRQLLCLARAVLSNNKILVLDEATANVDLRTDFLIQKTIRRKFASNTVLTVAHRINTIMDSDKVIVMESGEAVEFGNPYLMLQNPDGYFYKIVQQTGSTMAHKLRVIAKNSYNNSKGNRII